MKECELIKGGHTFGPLAVNPFLCLDIPSKAQASGLDGAFFSITAPL